MEEFTIYCSEKQCQIASKLGARIGYKPRKINEPRVHNLVTAEQMIGWLESKGVQCETVKRYDEYNTAMYSYYMCVDSVSLIECELRFLKNEMPKFKSRKEATLAAIDATLEYLIKRK